LISGNRASCGRTKAVVRGSLLFTSFRDAKSEECGAYREEPAYDIEDHLEE